MTYELELEWVAIGSSSKNLETELSSQFRPTDEDACIWADGPVTVRISFQVDAESFEQAMDRGKAEFAAVAGSPSLPGALRSATVSDNDGYLAWSANSD